jgi:hypothetical protein
MSFSFEPAVKPEVKRAAESTETEVFGLRRGLRALYSPFGMLLNAINQRHPKQIDAKGNARA